jgi:hypothetical protein
LVPQCGLRLLSCVLVSILVLPIGCAREKVLPTAVPLPGTSADQQALRANSAGAAPPPGRSFYPLQVGSHWEYEGSFASSVVSKSGEIRSTKRGTWSRETVLVGNETPGGTQYVRETIIDPTQIVHFVTWLRQDRSGLYELGMPPVGSGPNPYPYERRLLAYPVHTGAKWVIEDPKFSDPHLSHLVTAEVEGMELLDTPAGRLRAWKIRVRDGGHLPGEEQFVWYGPQGYLGWKVHLQYERPYLGADTVVVTEDQSEWLKAFELSPRNTSGPQ